MRKLLGADSNRKNRMPLHNRFSSGEWGNLSVTSNSNAAPQWNSTHLAHNLLNVSPSVDSRLALLTFERSVIPSCASDEVSVHLLPDEIRKFVDEYITSVDRIEILRVLSERPDREYRIDELSKEIQAPRDRVIGEVTSMQAQGLLATEMQSDSISAKYSPRNAVIAGQLEKLIALYRERPVTMIRFVYERAHARLRAFSDAFKFRKEE
jgi:hypothetical protein